MSFNDNPDIISRSWAPYLTNLIYLVKKYPITYYPSATKKQTKLYKAKWDTAWIDIGRQLCQPSKTCKQVWTKIKFKYAKVINLINTGKITKEAAISHPETAKFFDGQLRFMDPFVCKITDEKIPFRIHKTINDLFCLKTKRTQHVPRQKRSFSQFVTHAQVKALLRERQSKEEDNLNILDTQYLQYVVDTAVKRKLDELLQKTDDLSNSNDETINTINVPMTLSKNLRNVRKRKPNFTLIPSKNINNDEENTTKTVNLGLETELIIEDDIKSEAEDDDINMEDDDDIKEEKLTLDNNTNDTTDENYDLEYILPSTQIIMPAAHNTMKNMNNDVTAVEYKMDNIPMVDNNETPVTDDYIRNFFNELGIVMSLELSICKQKILKSRINELLKDILLTEEGHRVLNVDSLV